MLADELSMTGGRRSDLLNRAGRGLRHLWACYWWLLRAHMAATYLLPRSCLEPPPADWMRVMQGPDR